MMLSKILAPAAKGAGALAFVAAMALVGAPAHAQDRASRAAMEQCTQRVLGGLAQKGAPETEAGPAVVSQCDRQLRAARASAIQTGEAANCKVDTCMDLARQRAAQEATMAYRQLRR